MGGNMIANTVTIVIALCFIIVAVLMIKGKGAAVVKAFISLNKNAAEKRYDVKKLTRFIGYVLLVIGILTPLNAVGGMYNIRLLTDGYVFAVIAIVVAAAAYCTVSSRFRK